MSTSPSRNLDDLKLNIRVHSSMQSEVDDYNAALDAAVMACVEAMPVDPLDKYATAAEMREFDDAVHDANLHIARATDNALASVLDIIDRNAAALKQEAKKLQVDLEKITDQAVKSLRKAGFAGNDAATLFAARQTEKVKTANERVTSLLGYVLNRLPAIRKQFAV